MKAVFLVQPDEAETARRIEKILLSLPEETGILFTGVTVVPDSVTATHRKVVYKVVIGCSRSRDPELIGLVARMYIRQEIKEESSLTLEVHRGITRSLDAST